MAATGAYQAILPRDPQIFNAGTIAIPEAASQTFVRGTPVLFSSGFIQACAATPTAIFGIAAEAGHNYSGTGPQNTCLVWPIRPNQQFQITVTNTMAQSQFGTTDFGIVKDATTGFWYLDSGDGGAQCRVIDFLSGPAGFAIGDSKWTAFAIFHSTKIQAT